MPHPLTGPYDFRRYVLPSPESQRDQIMAPFHTAPLRWDWRDQETLFFPAGPAWNSLCRDCSLGNNSNWPGEHFSQVVLTAINSSD